MTVAEATPGADETAEPPILVLDTGGFSASEINALAISHDDRLLAVGSGKEVGLWEISSGRRLVTLRGYREPDGFNIGKVNALSFTPDGRYLVVGVTDNSKLGSTRIYDLAEPESGLKLVPGHTGCTVGAFMADDGRRVFTYGCADKLEVFGIDAASSTSKIDEEIPIGFVDRPQTDMTRLFCAYPDEKWVMIRDYGRLAILSRGHGRAVDSTAEWPAELRRMLEWERKLEPLRLGTSNGFSGRPALRRGHPSIYVRGGFSKDAARSQFWVGVWDVESPSPTKVYKAHTYMPNIIAVSPSGQLVASSDLLGEVHVWRVSDGRTMHRMASEAVHFFGVEWRGKDDLLLSTSSFDQSKYRYGHYGSLDHSFHLGARTGLQANGTGRACSLVSKMQLAGMPLRIEPKWGGGVGWLEFSADEKRLTVAPVKPKDDSVVSHVVIGDNLVVGTEFGQLLQMRPIKSLDPKYAAQFHTVRRFKGHRAAVTGLSVSPDGRLASCSLDGTVRLWSLQPPRDTGDVGAAMEGNRLECGVAGTPHDMNPGDTIITFDGRSFYERRRAMASGQYVPGQKVRVQFERGDASLETTIELKWAAEEAEALCTLYVHGPANTLERRVSDCDWIMWTPDGHYDCSPGGEKYIGWHVNVGRANPAKYYAVGQFRKQLYAPATISKAIMTPRQAENVTAAGIAPVSEAGGIEASLPPEVRIVSPRDGEPIDGDSVDVVVEVLARATLREQDVDVTVNDRPAGEQRKVSETPQSDGFVRTRYAFVSHVDGPACSIRAVARHSRAESRVVSRELKRKNGDAPADAAGRRLFVLAVGVSKYRQADLNLRAAASDARAFAKTMSQLQGRLFERVSSNVLVDEQATADRVQTAMDTLAQEAKGARDVVYIFISGHSMVHNQSFRFLSHDFDDARARATSIGVGELHDWYQRELKAEGILFADTCHAGGVTQLPGAASSPWLGSQRLIIAACGPSSESLEDDDHGYFTQAILEACGEARGIADMIPKDGRLSVDELVTFIKDRVANLSGGRQLPLVYDPGIAGSWSFFAY
jgi:WD40 repeat protein